VIKSHQGRELSVHPRIPSKGGICEGFAIELADAEAKSKVGREVSETATLITSYDNQKQNFRCLRLGIEPMSCARCPESLAPNRCSQRRSPTIRRG
jgi:hypothetical protein